MTTQTIFRNASAEKNFTSILNSALQDPKLTPEEGWLLVFMLSQPVTWGFNTQHVIKHRRMGRDRVQAALRGLCAAAYAKRLPIRDNKGRAAGYEYWFTDLPGQFCLPKPEDQAPAASPEPELPAPVVPEPEDQAPYKEITLEKNDNTKNPPNPPKGGFDEFWNAYPKKVARGKARQLFDRICKDCTADAETLISAAQRYASTVRGKDPDYVKHPATWLNQECWADEPVRSRAGLMADRFDAGPTVRDTSEPFHDFFARMKAEGKLKVSS